MINLKPLSLDLAEISRTTWRESIPIGIAIFQLESSCNDGTVGTEDCFRQCSRAFPNNGWRAVKWHPDQRGRSHEGGHYFWQGRCGFYVLFYNVLNNCTKTSWQPCCLPGEKIPSVSPENTTRIILATLISSITRSIPRWQVQFFYAFVTLQKIFFSALYDGIFHPRLDDRLHHLEEGWRWRRIQRYMFK